MIDYRGNIRIHPVYHETSLFLGTDDQRRVFLIIFRVLDDPVHIHANNDVHIDNNWHHWIGYLLQFAQIGSVLEVQVAYAHHHQRHYHYQKRSQQKIGHYLS